MRFSDAVSRLNARQPEHMPGPSLDRIREIVGLLDQPQLTYPSIHITGTNGKTTAARVAASVACAHGITVGLYTSPHLLSVTERLSICGRAHHGGGVRSGMGAPRTVPPARGRTRVR